VRTIPATLIIAMSQNDRIAIRGTPDTQVSQPHMITHTGTKSPADRRDST